VSLFIFLKHNLEENLDL